MTSKAQASTAERKFDDEFSCGILRLSFLAASEQPVEVVAGEGPLEGFGHLLVMGLETENAGLDLLAAAEIVRAERLPLEHREVDLDLIQPAGMDRQVDGAEGGPLAGEPVDGSLPPVDGAVVQNPEDSVGRGIGLGGHDPSHEGIEGLDRVPPDHLAEELGPVDVPGSLVGTGTVTPILVLDPHRPARGRRRGWMPAAADLELGLLVDREHEVTLAQELALPAAV